MKKTIIIILIIIVVGVAGYFGFQQFQKAQQSAEQDYQTVALERGDINAIVGATGTVRTNQTTTVGWQTSGRIAEILVEIDDNVVKGEELANLDESTLSQSLIMAKSDLIGAQRALDDLLGSDLAQKQAYQAYVNAKDTLDEALEDRESMDYERASQNSIDLARSDYIVAQDTVIDLEKDFDDYFANLLEDDPVRAQFMSRLAAARQSRDRSLAQLNYLLSMPDQLEIEQADALVEVTRAQLEDAKREWERLEAGTDPNDIAAAEARIEAIESTLKMISMEAPFNGQVTSIPSKVGDQVAPGTVSFRIDDLSRLLVDVEITEVDINRIQLGQPVELTFDAIMGEEFNGIITEVARVGTNVQGVVNFTVTIEITDADENVRSGMTAAVNIIVEQVENVLMVPNRAVRMLEGDRVVYVLRNGMQEVEEIEIGVSSETHSELISGNVEIGEKFILNPTFEFNMMGGPPGGGMR
jgi:HlyD family secretion protein